MGILFASNEACFVFPQNVSRAHEGNGIKSMSKKSYRPNAKSCFLVAFRLRAKLKILKMASLGACTRRTCVDPAQRGGSTARSVAGAWRAFGAHRGLCRMGGLKAAR